MERNLMFNIILKIICNIIFLCYSNKYYLLNNIFIAIINPKKFHSIHFYFRINEYLKYLWCNYLQFKMSFFASAFLIK